MKPKASMLSYEPTKLTQFKINLVQLLDLLLYPNAKFQRMRDLLKGFGSPARPDHHNRSITQHAAENRLTHFDALYFDLTVVLSSSGRPDAS